MNVGILYCEKIFRTGVNWSGDSWKYGSAPRGCGFCPDTASRTPVPRRFSSAAVSLLRALRDARLSRPKSARRLHEGRAASSSAQTPPPKQPPVTFKSSVTVSLPRARRHGRKADFLPTVGRFFPAGQCPSHFFQKQITVQMRRLHAVYLDGW